MRRSDNSWIFLWLLSDSFDNSSSDDDGCGCGCLIIAIIFILLFFH